LNPLPRALAAELVGTFALVLAGTGSIVANAMFGGEIGHVGISLTFGLVIMAMIYAVGHISGAHFNPAVTLGFVIARHFPAQQVVPYWLAQIAGALLGSIAVRTLIGNTPGLGGTHPANGLVPGFVLEVALTFILMFVIMAVATDTRAVGEAAALAIGGTVALEALFAGPITGASMNPARSLGPAVVAGDLGDIWLYLLAPTVGAALGAVTYRWIGAQPILGKEREKESRQEMQTDKQRVLFLCTHNSARSQMAEGWLHYLGGSRFEVESAGTEATGVRPLAIRAMEEAGIDISTHQSKTLDRFLAQPFDLVITVCDDAAETCPVFPGPARRIHWSFPDPSQATGSEAEQLEVYRQVRDAIRARIEQELVAPTMGSSTIPGS
jgi:thioredoxin type arsenate reductase